MVRVYFGMYKGMCMPLGRNELDFRKPGREILEKTKEHEIEGIETTENHIEGYMSMMDRYKDHITNNNIRPGICDLGTLVAMAKYIGRNPWDVINVWTMGLGVLIELGALKEDNMNGFISCESNELCEYGAHPNEYVPNVYLESLGALHVSCKINVCITGGVNETSNTERMDTDELGK